MRCGLVNESCPDAVPLLLSQAFALLAPKPQPMPPASQGSLAAPERSLPLPETLEEQLRKRVPAATLDYFVASALE
jgi:hypothetical protein